MFGSGKYYSFLLSSQVSRQTRAKTLATQAILYIHSEIYSLKSYVVSF